MVALDQVRGVHPLGTMNLCAKCTRPALLELKVSYFWICICSFSLSHTKPPLSPIKHFFPLPAAGDLQSDIAVIHLAQVGTEWFNENENKEDSWPSQSPAINSSAGTEEVLFHIIIIIKQNTWWYFRADTVELISKCVVEKRDFELSNTSLWNLTTLFPFNEVLFRRCTLSF